MEFIETSRGKPCLLFEGHRYRVHRKTSKSTSWLCIKERWGCHGRIKMSGDQTIVSRQGHSCKPDEGESEIVRKLHLCKKRAQEDVRVPVHQIFKEEMGELKENGFGHLDKLPDYQNVKTTLCLARRNALRKSSVVAKSFANAKVSNGEQASTEQTSDLDHSESGTSSTSREPAKRKIKELDVDPVETQNGLLKMACDLLSNLKEEESSECLNIGKVWGTKLMSLDPIQRKLAEKAINDILFEAEMGTLHRNSVQINSNPPDPLAIT